MQAANRWTLLSHVATLAFDTQSAKLDLEQPNLGLQSLRVDAAIRDRRLAIAAADNSTSWPAKLVDDYVRGNDLVATYAGDDHWPYRPQIYWCADADAVSSAAIAPLSLVVSIQTNLLDTHPRIVVESTLEAKEVLLVSVGDDGMLVDSHSEGVQTLDPRATACGLVWRLPGHTLSYAEIMPTTDVRALAVLRANGAIGSRWELFAEFLEKGVIRRARLQSLFLPRENDVQLTAEACQAIEHRPLPLTT